MASRRPFDSALTPPTRVHRTPRHTPMSTRSASESESEWSATVAVRVPETDDGDLATAARRRLTARNGIEAVDVVTLQAIEPTLAATVVRLAVRVRVPACADRETVAGQLNDAPGVQRVDGVTRP